MTKIVKRNGTIVDFDINKVSEAIIKAMKFGSGRLDLKVVKDVCEEIEKCANIYETTTVSQIEELVFNLLCEKEHKDTARAYEQYRSVREFQRKTNTTDKGILTLVENMNTELKEENSNKNPKLASTQRDYIAGEVSKDIAKRKLLPPHIVQAHDEGILHFHDMDYTIQNIFNCCLVDIQDMLDNGTVINGNMIESPNSFQVACTVMTQIIAQVASNQYGGQSISIKHLGKYLRKSRDRFVNMLPTAPKEVIDTLVRKELESGIQTIQYQVQTIMSTNGQAPFITLFLDLDEEDEYAEEVSLIIEQILKQRLQGIKNEKGVYYTPTFPKLVYVLHEHNCLEGGKYDYLTKIAVECSSKRLYPDYISSKRMKEIYEGNVFSPMGCRSFLSSWKDANGNYKWEGRFNQGVVSLNLPQIGIIAKGDEQQFWKLLDNRLELCFSALMCRHKLLLGTTSDTSPIHWQHGAIARLEKGETIDSLLKGGYSTISLGYIGLYEVTKLMTGKSHTNKEGTEFALKVLQHLKDKCEQWKKETGLGFGLYGTPAESLCYRFARIDKEKYGEIKDVTDKGYYTNSYHVDVRENINAFDKLKFESQFQHISTGGCISYIEIPNMNHNLTALKQLINYIYHNIQYAEFNTKSDNCHVCGFEGEVEITEDLQWRCPDCGNTDQDKMNIVRRTCGYLGANGWNKGKTQEIKNRVLHL